MSIKIIIMMIWARDVLVDCRLQIHSCLVWSRAVKPSEHNHKITINQLLLNSILYKLYTRTTPQSQQTQDVYEVCAYETLFTFPKEPCPSTLSSSNCEGSAFSAPSLTTCVMLISLMSPSSYNTRDRGGNQPQLLSGYLT